MTACRAWRGWDVENGSLVGPVSREAWAGGVCEPTRSANIPLIDGRDPGIHAWPTMWDARYAIAVCPVVGLIELRHPLPYTDHVVIDVLVDGVTVQVSARVPALVGDGCTIERLFVDGTVDLTDPGLVAIPTHRFTTSSLIDDRLGDFVAACIEHGVAPDPWSVFDWEMARLMQAGATRDE